MTPRPRATLAVCALTFACLALGRADDGDQTRRFYLGKSDLVVAGQMVAEPAGVTRESGVPNYLCDFKITEVLKGDDALAGKTIGVNIVRFELGLKDRHPLLKKDAECILFLKSVARDKPAWQTVDVWFGIQHPWPWLARSLKRLAVEMKDRTSAFDIQCRKRDDRVTAMAEGDRVVLDVTSPSGIGGVQITRKEAAWPNGLTLRLHLSGLESLTIAAGKTTLKAAVLSHGKFDRQLHLLTDYREGPALDTTSPFWTEIRACNADGQPTAKLPDHAGWFEVLVPRALLGEDVAKLEVNWIDFYR